MDTIFSADKNNVLRKSSIDQYKDHFSVYGQGGWFPIEFDVIEHIGCHDMGTHRAILSLNENDLGYNFPEACCVTTENEYVLADQNHRVRHYTDADNASLGIQNHIGHRVGLDYYVADETLTDAE